MKHDKQEFLFNEWCDQQCCKYLFGIEFAEYEEVNAWSGSTLFLLGARASSGVSTGRPSGSATRKHKCLLGGVRPVVSHESEEPRRSNTPGSFLGKRSPHPQQSRLIGEGGGRKATYLRHFQFPKER